MELLGLFLSNGSFIPFEDTSQTKRIEVVLTDSRIVERLRIRVSEMQTALDQGKEQLRRTEYMMMTNSELANRLQAENDDLWDLVEENGLRRRPPGRQKKKRRTS